MRVLRSLGTSAIAIVTIVAMLLVPACGSLCAAMNHCASTAPSADSDACHHANVSARSDSESLSSPASCSQPSPLLAVLAGSDSSLQVESVFGAHASFSIDIPIYAFTVNSQFREFPSSTDSPQQSSPLESLSVLRI